MIYALLGDMGSGKGIFSMEMMEQQWRIGRTIATNMELLPGCPFHEQAIRIGTKEWPIVGDDLCIWDYAHLLRGAFILIDEADIDFDCSDHAKLERRAKAWLKHSRKMGQDIVFVLQNLSNLAVRIRRLIQLVWVCEWTYRSAPGFQMLGNVLGGVVGPEKGQAIAKGLTKYIRYQYASIELTRMIEMTEFPYNSVANKFFREKWYDTDQIIGSTVDAESLLAQKARDRRFNGDDGGDAIEGVDPLSLAALAARHTAGDR